METVIIRKATLIDLSALLDFEKNIIMAERPFDITIKDHDDIHYYDIAAMITAPQVEVAVAQLGGEIVGSGYARLENSKIFLKHQNHGYLGFMYVVPAQRGKGINNLIMKYLSQWCISQQITELRLDVYYDNLPAVRAYEKVGFKKLLVEMRLNLNDK